MLPEADAPVGSPGCRLCENSVSKRNCRISLLNDPESRPPTQTAETKIGVRCTSVPQFSGGSEFSHSLGGKRTLATALRRVARFLFVFPRAHSSSADARWFIEVPNDPFKKAPTSRRGLVPGARCLDPWPPKRPGCLNGCACVEIDHYATSDFEPGVGGDLVIWPRAHADYHNVDAPARLHRRHTCSAH